MKENVHVFSSIYLHAESKYLNFEDLRTDFRPKIEKIISENADFGITLNIKAKGYDITPDNPESVTTKLWNIITTGKKFSKIKIVGNGLVRLFFIFICMNF